MGDKKHAIASPRNYPTKALFWGVKSTAKMPPILLRRHLLESFNLFLVFF
ncbi:hypothetical protein N203_01145 [Helicobacter pylori UM084]|nr:hypothetical protein N203_01145 [Helicobacter pylori UM084]